jgi:hypothetical protein
MGTPRVAQGVKALSRFAAVPTVGVTEKEDRAMTNASGDPRAPQADDETVTDESSEQTAGAGANNPARPSETGGNSIEIGDTIQDVVEMDPGQSG